MAQKPKSGCKHPRAANDNKNASATKKGPGRFHMWGLQKAKNRRRMSETAAGFAS